MTARAHQQPLQRRLGLAMLSFACVCVIGVDAQGRSLERSHGVGFEQTLTAQPTSLDNASVGRDVSASGLLLQYWISTWSVELIVGGRAAIIPDQPMAWAAFSSVGAHGTLLRAPQVNLTAGLRVALGLSKPVDAAGNAQPLRYGVNLEVPLRAMYFLSDHFVITGAVGVVFSFSGDGVHPLEGSQNTSSLSLFRGGFSGGLGFIVLLN